MLRSCTIRSYNCDKNFHHLRSWILEGSNDNQAFVHLDEQIDCSFLNSKNAVHTFQINNTQNQPFKILRLRQTDKNWCKRYFLTIDSIEFFGTLL